jgi:hypothetical protein
MLSKDLITFFLAVSLCIFGCSGGKKDEPQETPAVPSMTMDAVNYNAPGQFFVGNLNQKLAGASDINVSLKSGPSFTYKLDVSNVLYFVSPDEKEEDSESVIRISSAGLGLSYDVKIPWHSTVRSSFMKVDEGDGDGDGTWHETPDDGSRLKITGITNGIATSDSIEHLSFQVTGAPTLSSKYSDIAIFTKDSEETITSKFIFNPSNNTFSVTPSGASLIRSLLKLNKIVSMAVSLGNNKYVFGAELSIRLGDASIALTVVNPDGSAATSSAGSQYVLRGMDTGISASGKIDDKGSFVFAGLPADTYVVQEILLGPGTPLMGFAVVSIDSSQVALTIVKRSVTASKQPSRANELIQETGNNVASYFVDPKSKTSLESKRQTTRIYSKNNQSTKETTLPPAYIKKVVLAAANTLNQENIDYLVPKGTTQIALHVDIYSEEYPEWTGKQSIYNDLWSFNIELPNYSSPWSATGKVNKTHAQQATISYDLCLDTTNSAKNNDVPIQGVLGVQNVADSKFETSVTLKVTLFCKELKVEKFSMTAQSIDGLSVVYPRKVVANETDPDGNLSGYFLSIPLINRIPSSFGVPAKIQYYPTKTKITQVELILNSGAGEVSLGKDYLKQADTSKPGELNFSGLLLNPTQDVLISSPTQLRAKLLGEESGEPATSEPYSVSLEGEITNFTPIYLSSEITSYDVKKRFGGHNESGGDSWGTLGMLNWLQASALPYNDISPALVKQFGPSTLYGSFLGHKGHSDAQQADIRYWDGQGGFSEPLNGSGKGAGILAMANAAQDEIESKKNPHPNFDKLVSWIAQNRTNLNSYATLK